MASAPVLKMGNLARGSWVRLPPSPPLEKLNIGEFIRLENGSPKGFASSTPAFSAFGLVAQRQSIALIRRGLGVQVASGPHEDVAQFGQSAAPTSRRA